VELTDLMAQQDGLVTRGQVLARGLGDGFIDTRLRRKDWRRVHRGVFIDHTGPLTWRQELWAALLFYGEADGRAAACDRSALVLCGISAPAAGSVVHVAVDRDRRVHRLPGVRLHRMTSFEEHVHPQRRPARLRLEVAVLQAAASARDEAAAIAVLADACQKRRTTPPRLVGVLDALPCLRRRAFMVSVLRDVAEGAHSVLEHRYLTSVERAHGLPRARRQRRGSDGRSGSAWRDCLYLGGLLVVELDGRLGHEWTEDRWADFDRDIEAAAGGALTLRLGWRQVLDPCRVAAALVRVLRRLGWDGEPHRCSPTCGLS
jgi:hypothetical protein